MVYFLISCFLLFIGYVLKVIINVYSDFRFHNPNQHWIWNMISQRTFNPVIDNSVNCFFQEVLKNQVLYYKDSEYYFNDGKSTLILKVQKNVVSLYHKELETYLVSTKNISNITLKCIKNAQKKLTTDLTNS